MNFTYVILIPLIPLAAFLLLGIFGAANMFSTALETIKFLSETSPMIGLSVASGTLTFLAPALVYLEAISKI